MVEIPQTVKIVGRIAEVLSQTSSLQSGEECWPRKQHNLLESVVKHRNKPANPKK